MENLTCQNCTHFRQHYIARHTQYVRTHSGHCEHYKKKSVPHTPCCLPCEHFTLVDVNKKIEQRNQSIQTVLQKISDTLHDIKHVLS